MRKNMVAWNRRGMDAMYGYPFDCITDFVFVDSEATPSDIILIPGSTDMGPVKRAAELYHKGMAPLLLPSGGRNIQIGEHPSEWHYMQQTAVEARVAKDCILKEDRAANTFENAKFSLKCIEQQRLTVKSAILVCRAFHSRRALMTYQTIFPPEVSFHVVTVPGEKEITRGNWFKRPEGISLVMEEVVKIGRYFDCEIEGLAKRFGAKSKLRVK